MVVQPEDKVKWSKRPANTAFKQQRLKAWQPILTPATVLPTFFLVGLIFVPLGGVLLWGSNQVRRPNYIWGDYTRPSTLAVHQAQSRGLEMASSWVSGRGAVSEAAGVVGRGGAGLRCVAMRCSWDEADRCWID